MNLEPNGSKSPLDPKFGPRGPNPPKIDCWGPGESLDTHIVGFWGQSAEFWIWCQKSLGSKFGPRGPNVPKNGCLGPGETIYTKKVRFDEKNKLGRNCIFLFPCLLLYKIASENWSAKIMYQYYAIWSRIWAIIYTYLNLKPLIMYLITALKITNYSFSLHTFLGHNDD